MPVGGGDIALLAASIGNRQRAPRQIRFVIPAWLRPRSDWISVFATYGSAGLVNTKYGASTAR